MSSLPAPSTSSPSSSTLTPTTRSRTLLFISYRDSSSRAPRKSRAGRQYEEAYQPTDENEGLIDHQAMPHTSLDVELPPKWVDYVEQVEEILAATQAKGARLFRRPKMSARCIG